MQHPLLQTFAYANAQRRLLTLEEVYRYQIKTQYTLSEIASEIPKMPQITTKQGLYGIVHDFEELLALRQEKGRESIRRYRQVKRYARLLISIPYIRGIFLAGSSSFSTGNAKKESDIDIFIVTKANTMWLARLLLTSITHILGIRRTGMIEENRFCLNHYVTDNALFRPDHTLYSAQLYSDYIAIGTESQKLLHIFWSQNTWRQEVYPYAIPREYLDMSTIHPYRIKYIIEYVWNHTSVDIGNTFAKWIQIQKIKSNTIQSNTQNRIQVSDTELEFHPEPNSNKVDTAINAILQKL